MVGAGALPRLMGAPRGDGHTVVDIPGWKAPDVWEVVADRLATSVPVVSRR